MRLWKQPWFPSHRWLQLSVSHHVTFHTPLHHSTPAGKKKKSSLSSRCCESTRLIKINSLLYLLVEGMCLDHAWRLDLGLAGGLAHCRSSKYLLALGSSPWAGGCALTRSSGRCTDCWSCPGCLPVCSLFLGHSYPGPPYSSSVDKQTHYFHSSPWKRSGLNFALLLSLFSYAALKSM